MKRDRLLLGAVTWGLLVIFFCLVTLGILAAIVLLQVFGIFLFGADVVPVPFIISLIVAFGLGALATVAVWDREPKLESLASDSTDKEA